MNKLSKLNVSFWNALFVFGEVMSVVCAFFTALLTIGVILSWVTHRPELIQGMNWTIGGIPVQYLSDKLILSVSMCLMFLCIFRACQAAHNIMVNFRYKQIFVDENLVLLKKIVIDITCVSVVIIITVILATLTGLMTWSEMFSNLGSVCFDVLLFNSFIYLLYTIFKHGLSLQNDSDLLI